MSTSLETRLEKLEARDGGGLQAQRDRWCEDLSAALAAAGTSEEIAAFDRALARSIGEQVTDGDPATDDAIADQLCARLPQELLARSWQL
jgi:hypothetical protein